jgi:hypothetical protein
MVRTVGMGTNPCACSQSRRDESEGHLLRSADSSSDVRGRLIWCLILGSDGLRSVGCRSAG